MNILRQNQTSNPAMEGIGWCSEPFFRSIKVVPGTVVTCESQHECLSIFDELCILLNLTDLVGDLFKLFDE